MSHDKKCRDLAKYFLSDEPAMNCEQNVEKLAEDIQSTIEDFFTSRRTIDENGNTGWTIP